MLPLSTFAEDLSFDFVVVGAGITGCTLSMGLHSQGFRVLLIEKESEVQDRFKGELLQPYAVEVLRQTGFSKILEESGGRKISELRHLAPPWPQRRHVDAGFLCASIACWAARPKPGLRRPGRSAAGALRDTRRR